MTEPAGRTIIVVNGRVEELPAHYPSRITGRGEATEGWISLALLGGLLLALGALVGTDQGSAAAIGGVVLFLATAVLGGAERYEFATALGVSGVVWTAAGMSVYLGIDPSLVGSFLGFAIVGVASVGAGTAGALRKRGRDSRGGKPVP